MFKEILLPIDLEETELTAQAIAVAQDIADHYGSRITVLTVMPDFGMPLVANYFPDDMMDKARQEIRSELEKLVEARFRDPSAVSIEVGQGSPHREIVNYAEEHGTDVIVMPSRAQDIGKVLLGSCATHVVEHAPCTVLIVRPQPAR